MTIKTFMTKELDAIKVLIAHKLPEEKFDSHEFIRKFSEKFELQYVVFLSKYKRKPYKYVHQQIGKTLLKHSQYLNIKNNGKIKSKNIFGNETENEEWIKMI